MSRIPASIVTPYHTFSQRAGIVVIGVGVAALLGWGFDIAVLKSILPGRVTLKPNTALGLIATGVALQLWHQQFGRFARLPAVPSAGLSAGLSGSKSTRKIERLRLTAYFMVCSFVIVLGLATIVEYSFGLNFGIDQLLFEMPPDAVDIAVGGRPAPNTAICLVLMAVALLLLAQNRYRAAQSLSAAVFAGALLALIGHLNAVAVFFQVGTVTGMAIHTAIALLLLSAGVLCARPEAGWMRDLLTEYAGSIMLRRILPWTIVLPGLLGVIILVIYRSLSVPFESAFALRSILDVVFFSGIIWWNGRWLNRIDRQHQAVQQQFSQSLEAQVSARTAELNAANQLLQEKIFERQQAEAKLRESEGWMRKVVTLAPFPLMLHAEDGEILTVSQALTEMTGYSAAELPTLDAWEARAWEHPSQSFAESLNDCSIMETDRTGKCEFLIRTKDDRPLIWDFNSASLGVAADGRRLMVSMAADITRRKQVEVALQKSQIKLQQQLAEIESIYQSAPIGLGVLDPDLRFVRINQRLAEMNGFSIDAHLGRTVGELLPDLADTAEQLLLPIFEMGQPLLNIEIRGETPAQPGVARIWLEHFLPLKDGDRVIGINAVCEEITERKHTEQALLTRAAQQAAVSQIGRQAIAINSIDALLDSVTTQVAQVLEADYCEVLELLTETQELRLRSGIGWPSNMIGQSTVEVDQMSWAGYTLHSMETVVVSDLSSETRFVSQSLDQHEIFGSMSTVIGNAEDHPFGVLGVHTRTRRDFSENDVNFLQAIANILFEAIARHRAEQRIRQANADLELRIAERTQQLVEVNQELEAFAYSVAHDLRAPLRAIEGFARILKEDYSSSLGETGQQYTQIMIDSAARLDRLIQDLLDYSQLGRRDIRLGTVNLARVIEGVVREIAATSEAPQPPQIEVIGQLPFALAQRGVLQQVLNNLLSNAIKFVPPSTAPIIRIWAEEQTQWIRLWIEDNGIGISPRHFERIFRPFERLQGIDQYSGTGIGLAIVQRGVERMSGKVGVEVGTEGGSRFWIELLRP